MNTPKFDATRNILEMLQPAVKLKLQKKIAADWNARRTDEAVAADKFFLPSDVTHATIRDVIAYTEAKKHSAAAATYRVSKAIRVADFTKKVTLVCPNTGINAIVDIPALPGFYLPYENPLSNLQNARLVAQKGYGYLCKLDTQILAGILIVLADDYNLFQYPVFSNGTSKNALLRSAGKDELIKAIVFIEQEIHSENYAALPRLSFSIDSDTKQNDMAARLCNWLSLINAELTAPKVVFEAEPKKQTGLQIERAKTKALEQAEKLQRKALLSFKRLLSEARDDIKSLYKDTLISIKLRNFLLSMIEPEVFQTLEKELKSKIILKLSTLPLESRITKLIAVFERDAVSIEEKDMFLDAPATPAQPIPVKSAFELQNSPEVIAEQKRIHAENLAKQKHQDDVQALSTRLRNPVSYDSQLLLTHDIKVGTGYDSILLNGEPIPEGRFQLQSVREAFAIVKNYTAPVAYIPPVEPEAVAYIGSPEQVAPTFGSEGTAMIEIAPGIMAPTALWNSMSIVKQAAYKRRLMAAQSK